MGKATILIADDDRNSRTALHTRLSSTGYDVVETKDCLGVLSQHPEGWADVLILDHEMPSGDGRSVARVIRHQSDIPIVFLSGHDREEFRAIVTELPDVYYLPKPLDDDKLAALLEALTAAPAPETIAAS